MAEDLVDPVVVATNPEVAGLDPQRLAHREERVEHQFLRYHAELAARIAIIRDDVVPHHSDVARIDPDEPGQGRNQRGLAGAVGAQQAEELAGADRQVDAVECSNRAIVLARAADFDRRLGQAASSSNGSRR